MKSIDRLANRRRRRGMAMMLVLGVIALASVLGMAILANTSLQSRVSQNSLRSVQSDGLAESGLNLARYYLLNPNKAPLLGSGGYYTGESNISPGVSSSGKVSLAVSQVTPGDLYDVTSVSKATGAGASRTLKMRVQTLNAPQKYALSSAGSISLPSNVTINGDMAVLKAFSTQSGSKVTGTAYTVTAGTSSGTVSGGIKLQNTAYFSIPTTVTNYRTYKYYNGSTWVDGAAQDLGLFSVLGTIVGLILPVTLGPSSSNPAGIFYTSQNLNLGQNVTVNGTIIVDGADLTLSGKNIVINASPTFPALIVNGNIINTSNSTTLTVNGVTWLSGQLKSQGAILLTPTLDFNGSLIFGGTSPSIDSHVGTVTMTYNASRAAVTHLGPDDSIAAVSWQQ